MHFHKFASPRSRVATAEETASVGPATPAPAPSGQAEPAAIGSGQIPGLIPGATPPDRRHALRFAPTSAGDCSCEIWAGSGQMFRAEILDMGVSGLRLRVRGEQGQPDLLPVGEKLTFGACSVAHWGELIEGQQGCVRWRREGEAGVLLAAPLCARARHRAQRVLQARRTKIYGA
ncbi:hypothetical protein [Megalodesulfovibrio paquesii]